MGCCGKSESEDQVEDSGKSDPEGKKGESVCRFAVLPSGKHL